MGTAGELDWEESRAWLSELGVYPFAGTTLVDFAADLRNGAVLCDAINRLKPGVIPEGSVHRNPSRQFLCFQNINGFLAACRNEFDAPPDVLFESEDLFHASQFQKVVRCMSFLSKTPPGKAAATPFPKTSGGFVKEDIYGGLESLMPSSSAALRSSSRSSSQRHSQHRTASSSVTGGPSLVLGGLGASSTTEEGDGDTDSAAGDDAEMFTENYDDLLGMVKEDIYGEVVGKGSKKRREKPPSTSNEKRKYIFQELIDTERSYIEVLELINSSFRLPMTRDRNRIGLSEQDLSCLFVNVDKLLDIHNAFMRSLDLQQDEGVSTSFLQHKGDFLAYAVYVGRLVLALDTLERLMRRREFAVSLDALQRQSKQKFFLKDLLSVPMQRILKYPLLLKDLISACKGQNESDIPELTRALRAMQDLAKHINECKRDSDNLSLVKDIQASLREYEVGSPGVVPLREFGRYLLDGDIKIRMDFDSRTAKRYVFLFQKTMLVCKQKGMYYHFCYMMNTKDFSLADEWVKARNIGIKMVSKHPSAISFNCTLLFKNEESKLEWLDVLTQAKYEVTAMLPEVAGTPHVFELKTFKKAETCDHCDFLLWGLLNQGFECEGCLRKVHRACLKKIDANCGGTSSKGKKPMRLPLDKAQTPGLQASARTRASTATLRPRARVPAPAPTSLASSIPEVWVAVHNFVNHKDKNEGDLSFQKGDQLTVLDKTSPHWWQARSARGQVGMVPASFIVPLGEEHAILRSQTISSKPRRSAPRHAGPLPPPAAAGDELPPPPASALPQADLDTYGVADEPPPRPGPSRSMTIATSRPRRAVPNPAGDPAPSLVDAPWFAGKLTREDADKLLIEAPDGSYLVRDSTTRSGEYTLCIKFGVVKHIKVVREGDECYISRRLHFDSLHKMIRHYQSFSLAASYKDIKTPLLHAIEVVTPPRPPKNTAAAVTAPAIMATAQFDFEAGTPDELSFKAGERVIVRAQEGCGEGWWKGEVRGTIGVFPAAYVKLLD